MREQLREQEKKKSAGGLTHWKDQKAAMVAMAKAQRKKDDS